MLKDKKGQNFSLASGIVLSLVAFVIFIVVGLLFLNILTTSQLLDDNRPSFTTLNEIHVTAPSIFLNQTGYTLASANSTTGTYVITGIRNATTNGLGFFNWTINTANASVTTAGVMRNTSTLNWANVSINYTFTDQTPGTYLTDNVRSNVTSGLFLVSNQLGTIFTIVAIVLVLAIIGLLIVVVRKFGFGGGSSNFGQ